MPAGGLDGGEVRGEPPAREGAARSRLQGEAQGRRAVREVGHGKLRFQLQTRLPCQDQHHVGPALHQGPFAGSYRDDGAGGHDGEVLDLARSLLQGHRGDSDLEGSLEGSSRHQRSIGVGEAPVRGVVQANHRHAGAAGEPDEQEDPGLDQQAAPL